MPEAIAAALLAAGASSGVALSSGIIVATVGGAAIKLGIGALAASAAAQARLPDQPSMRRALEVARRLVVNRTAYGRSLVVGSPLRPYKVTRQVYGCMILNNRPSAGGDIFTYTDSRPSPAASEPWGDSNQFTQDDVYDFAGEGFAPQPDPFTGFEGDPGGFDFFRIWIGKGDQTSPPDRILSEAGSVFTENDGGEGLTVLWYRLDLGDDNEKYYRRWPSMPRAAPSIEVLMDTSKVWDPRDGTQDPDDPSTWKFSKNQALITLDALLNNPVAPFSRSQIDTASFEDGADIADEAVALKRGGTEARYEVAGTIQWTNSEIFSQIEPLARAGGGRLVDIGGRIGYAPGAWTSPIYTLSDALDGRVLSFSNMKLSRDVPRQMQINFTNPDNAYEQDSLPPLAVASGGGADASLEGGLIDSATRAARVQKIEASRRAAQKVLTLEAPSDAIKCVPWSNVTVDLPGLEDMDGVMRVISTDPTIFLREDGGAAMRCPMALEEHSEAMYDWSVEDEPETLFSVESDVTTAGEVTFTGVAPASENLTQVAIYKVATGGAFTDATLIGTETAIDDDLGFTVTATTTAGAADFYVAPLDDDDAVLGTPSGPYSLTIS
ncbi:phage tail protein [Mameliella alba]|uniref:phage tail protein n=2 Tax=Mameliella alba TaxID=561184 RepID=UPI000B52C451|nr:phage tail protein [Mameliella alba]OWV44199.1 hypothetical protein CDZ95_05805 [Mameliella alba]